MKYDKEKLEQHIESLYEIKRYVGDDIVWEGQCGQSDHFDRLNKAEQVALIDIFGKIKASYDALISYKQWFEGYNYDTGR